MSWRSWIIDHWPVSGRELVSEYRGLAEHYPLVMADLARVCNVADSSFVAGDPAATAFNEGARNVFLHISQMSGLNPNDVNQLIQELENERRRQNKRPDD